MRHPPVTAMDLVWAALPSDKNLKLALHRASPAPTN